MRRMNSETLQGCKPTAEQRRLMLRDLMRAPADNLYRLQTPFKSCSPCLQHSPVHKHQLVQGLMCFVHIGVVKHCVSMVNKSSHRRVSDARMPAAATLMNEVSSYTASGGALVACAAACMQQLASRLHLSWPQPMPNASAPPVPVNDDLRTAHPSSDKVSKPTRCAYLHIGTLPRVVMR